MSKRRLDKLEGSLGPKEAVLRWMDEAHAFGSLPTYTASLFEQPEAVQPFPALPSQVADAVYQSMRHERAGFVKEVAEDAIGDTIFLLRLVLGLNVHIEGVVRTESLRHVALHWWSRAIDRRDDTKLPPEWHAGVATLVATIQGTGDALRLAEARYLGGHDVIFPELAAEWQALLAAVGTLERGGQDEPRMRVSAAQRVKGVVAMARADGLDAVGRSRTADRLAHHVAHPITPSMNDEGET